MSLSLESINNAAYFVATTAFEGISKGASLAAEGVSWTGRQVVALGPVLKEAASAVACQIVKVAKLVASIASNVFSALAAVALKGYQVGAKFIMNNPRDIAFGVAAAAVGVALTLLFQNAFADSKEPAKA